MVLAPRDYKVVSFPNYLSPSAKLIEAFPRNRSLVDKNTILTLTFDHPVAAVAGATGVGTTWDNSDCTGFFAYNVAERG